MAMPVGKKRSNKRLRDTQRLVHLAGGLVLIAYVYTPWIDAPLFTALIRVVVVPGLILTGLAMWQLPRLRARMNKMTGVRGDHASEIAAPATRGYRWRRRDRTVG